MTNSIRYPIETRPIFSCAIHIDWIGQLVIYRCNFPLSVISRNSVCFYHRFKPFELIQFIFRFFFLSLYRSYWFEIFSVWFFSFNYYFNIFLIELNLLSWILHALSKLKIWLYILKLVVCSTFACFSGMFDLISVWFYNFFFIFACFSELLNIFVYAKYLKNKSIRFVWHELLTLNCDDTSVTIVLPLPDPDNPKEHEACCPLCKNVHYSRCSIFHAKAI